MADTEKAPQPQPQQQEPAPQPQQTKQPAKQKQVIAEKVAGVVKWFNVKSGYGFINRNDTREDVFVHQTAIARNNPRKAVRSVGDGEAVEFAVVAGEKGYEAAGVTGPGGEPVKGSPYAADKRRGFHRQYYPRQGVGRGATEGAPRRGGMVRRGAPANEGGVQQRDETQDGNVVQTQRRYFRRNFRGGRRAAGPGPMNRGGYRGTRPRNNYQGGQQQGQGAQRVQNGSEAGQGEASAPAAAATAGPASPAAPTAAATSPAPPAAAAGAGAAAPAQQQTPAKPKATKPAGTTIETTTNESQA